MSVEHNTTMLIKEKKKKTSLVISSLDAIYSLTYLVAACTRGVSGGRTEGAHTRVEVCVTE